MSASNSHGTRYNMRLKSGLRFGLKMGMGLGQGVEAEVRIRVRVADAACVTIVWENEMGYDVTNVWVNKC